MVTDPDLRVDLGARDVVARVVDPEMPMLTLDDLGVIRSVEDHDGSVVVTITPTYSGCPAIEVMRDDIRLALGEAGYRGVEVRIVFSPAWSTDWISEAGRRKLAEAGIAPPGKAPARAAGPIGGRGGRHGLHTEHLGPLLAVLQSLAREHPGATW